MKIFSKLISTVSIIWVVLVPAACKQKNADTSKRSVMDTLKLIPGNEYVGTDQSPLDISYYPNEYPQNKMAAPQPQLPPLIRVIYSRPHKKGRVIFGSDEKSLCRYGKLWRLGANESTEIEFFQPVVIEGKNFAAGKYILYCIPFADKWVIAFNSNLYSWGLQIDPLKDIFRLEIPTQKQTPLLEDFTMVFETAGYGADLLMAWDDVKILLPITFSK
jgi:hypothetical protein